MGKITELAEKIVILIILNLLWFVITIFSLGICSGAATVSLFKICDNILSNNNPVDIYDCIPRFFVEFRSNFKNSTIIWLSTITIISISIFNIRYTFIQGNIGIFTIIQIIILIQIFIINIYVYYLLAKFEAPLKRIVISSLMIGNAHLFTTLTAVILFIASIIAVEYTNYTLGFVLVSGYTLILTYILKPILKKYEGVD